MTDRTLELAHKMADWFKENGYEEIDGDEVVRIHDWLMATDTSGQDVHMLCIEYELQMF